MKEERQVRFGWMVVALLFLGSVVNYVDRAVLSVVMPQVRRSLAMSNEDYGLAVNAFLLLYAVFYVLGGRLADRLGYRRMFSLTIVFWSLASMLHAAAQGLRSLILFRALLGAGEGGFYPTAIRAASNWFAPKDRAKAVGVLLCGISVGMVMTPPAVAWITHYYGWRVAFLLTGALGVLLVPPWLLLHRRMAALGVLPAAGGGSAAADAPEDLSLVEVLRRRKYWLVLGARALSDSAWYFYLFWMPGYFQESRGFDLRMVGILLWIPYLASDIGALGGAWTSSALIRRGMSLDGGRKSVLVPSALLAATGALAYFARAPQAALLLVSIALLGHQSWSSNLHTVITEITPQKQVAALYGITGAAGTLLGALAQPGIGRVVDHFGYGPAFVTAGAVYALAIALLLAAGRIEPMRRQRA